jgi:hypothetical protein
VSSGNSTDPASTRRRPPAIELVRLVVGWLALGGFVWAAVTDRWLLALVVAGVGVVVVLAPRRRSYARQDEGGGQDAEQ